MFIGLTSQISTSNKNKEKIFLVEYILIHTHSFLDDMIKIV